MGWIQSPGVYGTQCSCAIWFVLHDCSPCHWRKTGTFSSRCELVVRWCWDRNGISIGCSYFFEEIGSRYASLSAGRVNGLHPNRGIFYLKANNSDGGLHKLERAHTGPTMFCLNRFHIHGKSFLWWSYHLVWVGWILLKSYPDLCCMLLFGYYFTYASVTYFYVIRK